MIVIDTNLLIYAHRSKTDENKSAQRAIALAAQNSKGCGIALPSISEFWSIVTNPRLGDRPSTPHEAEQFVSTLCEDAQIKILEPHEDFGSRFIQLAKDLDVTGLRIFDLQIALIAFENGASELWTHDKDFVRMPGLKVIDPLE